MHALTLHQPYATLVVFGLKRIEWRNWDCPDRLVGERLAIHAGKRTIEPAMRRARANWPHLLNGHFPNSALVGTVRVAESIHVHKEALDFVDPVELDFRDPNAAYAWLLEFPERFEYPIREVAGSQGLWRIGR